MKQLILLVLTAIVAFSSCTKNNSNMTLGNAPDGVTIFLDGEKLDASTAQAQAGHEDGKAFFSWSATDNVTCLTIARGNQVTFCYQNASYLSGINFDVTDIANSTCSGEFEVEVKDINSPNTEPITLRVLYKNISYLIIP